MVGLPGWDFGFSEEGVGEGECVRGARRMGGLEWVREIEGEERDNSRVRDGMVGGWEEWKKTDELRGYIRRGESDAGKHSVYSSPVFTEPASHHSFFGPHPGAHVPSLLSRNHHSSSQIRR